MSSRHERVTRSAGIICELRTCRAPCISTRSACWVVCCWGSRARSTAPPCAGASPRAWCSSFDPKRPWDRARVLMSAQAGRIAAYVIAGTILGAAGARLYGAFDHAAVYRLLQWAGAVTLMWIGLSVAGVLPSLSLLDRYVAALSARISAVLSRFRRFPVAGPFAAGLGWGTVPCPMVYAALFTATLTGSAAGGATLMAGFGLGTLPAVTLTAFGVTTLARVEAKALARGVDRPGHRHPRASRPSIRRARRRGSSASRRNECPKLIGARPHEGLTPSVRLRVLHDCWIAQRLSATTRALGLPPFSLM